MIYVVLGSIGSIIMLTIFGSFAGMSVLGEYAKFQTKFVGNVIKLSVKSADKVFSITQKTITTVGKTTLATISATSSAITKIQKTLFDVTFFIASKVGMVIEGSVTTVKEALEILTRLAEKIVTMIASLAKTSIDIVSRAMKTTVKMIGKTVDSVKKFAIEVFVPALRKTFKLTKEMAMTVTKIMTRILPIYLEFLKRGTQIVVGGEVFTVGLYAVSAYVAMSIQLGTSFVRRIFGTNVVELIIDSLRGVFSNIFVGTLDPFSICSVVTGLIQPILGPIVAPNIPVFGSTLKRCDTQLIKAGLFLSTKGKLCKNLPSVFIQAISCVLERVGSTEIIPSIPRIGFSVSQLLELIDIPSRVTDVIGSAIPSIGIGGFGPFSINSLLRGIFDALVEYLEMALRELTKEMSSLASSFGTAYKSVSFSTTNPKQSGALATQAKDQTRNLQIDASNLTSSLNALSQFPPKFPELDTLYSNVISPLLESLRKRIRLLGNITLLDFNSYRILYRDVLSSVNKAMVEDGKLIMNDHGYAIGDQVFIEITGGGVSRRRISSIISKDVFITDLQDVVANDEGIEVFEAPFDDTSSTVAINVAESFLLRVIRKKYFARFLVDENVFSPPEEEFTDIVNVQNVFYGIGGVNKNLWINSGGSWAEDIGSPINSNSLVVIGGDLYVAADEGVSVRNNSNGTWSTILPNVNARALATLKPDRLVVGTDRSLIILSLSSGAEELVTADVDGAINSAVVDEEKQIIYVVGEFNRINDVTMNMVSGYRLTDRTWFSLREGINEPNSPNGASKIIYYGDSLVVYGDFNPVYIYNIPKDIWNRVTPRSRIFSHTILDDGILLFCLNNRELSFLYPGETSLVGASVEISQTGSLFQDGDFLYIRGVNRININKVRLALPSVVGTITLENGVFVSSIRLFAGTRIVIGRLRTRVTGVFENGSLSFDPPLPSDFTTARFIGVIPSISDEIALVYFANSLADYTLELRSEGVEGELTVGSDGVVTSDKEIPLGTILNVGELRVKVVEIVNDNYILVPPFPESDNGTTKGFTGRIPTILSILNDIVQQNSSNVFIKDPSEREPISSQLEILYTDFVEFTSTIPIRYLTFEALNEQNVLVANFIVSVPEFTLLKYRVGQVEENQKTASIITMLSTVFRQIMLVIVRKIKQMVSDEANSTVDRVLRPIPTITTPSFCIAGYPSLDSKLRPIWVCTAELPSYSINFGDIANKVLSEVDKLIDSLINESDAFVTSIMGPVLAGVETPAFNFN